MNDPWVTTGSTFAFSLVVDRVKIGEFAEVSGLSVSVKVEPVEEGGENQFIHKLPGRMEWPNLVLKRGVTDNDELFEWFLNTSGYGFAGAGNKLVRVPDRNSRQQGDMALILYGSDLGNAAFNPPGNFSPGVVPPAPPMPVQPLRTWRFTEAFPVKWTGPQFAADSNTIVTETLEVAHHGFAVD